MLAPLALVAFAVALIIVASSSGVEDEKGDAGAPAKTSTSAGGKSSAKPKQSGRRRYTVKPGDTLGAIAEKTGVSVAKLEELNPELDPQSLVAGQKIKLRE